MFGARNSLVKAAGCRIWNICRGGDKSPYGALNGYSNTHSRIYDIICLCIALLGNCGKHMGLCNLTYVLLPNVVLTLNLLAPTTVGARINP